MIGVQGNYTLRLLLGKTPVPVSPHSLNELLIVHDIRSVLPVFEISLKDAEGIFTHRLPLDAEADKLTVILGNKNDLQDYVDYDFRIIRRKPEGENQLSSTYEASGILDTGNFVAPRHRRAFTGTARDMIEVLGKELGAQNFEISESLDVPVTVVQRDESNAVFLSRVLPELVGKDSNACYHLYMIKRSGERWLVCKSVNELIQEETQTKYILADTPFHEYSPVYDYEFVDNYQLLNYFSGKSQRYSYFDYDTGEYVTKEMSNSVLYSLTDYFLIDSTDEDVSLVQQGLGRHHHDSTMQSSFGAKVQSAYMNRLMGLSTMWITIPGNVHLSPGMTVKILLGQGHDVGESMNHQYNGFWLCTKVVHMVGSSFLTRLLLQRNGVDTDVATSLVKAKGRVKRR